jgi:uncharacterized membrane protein YfcA
VSVIALALACGVVVGSLLGLVGGGGSMLTVPMLVYLLGAEVRTATATSLVVVGAAALVGVAPHARAGRVAGRTALVFAAAGLVGAPAGAWLGRRLDPDLAMVLFGGMMLLMAARMLRGAPAPPAGTVARAAVSPLAIVAGLGVGVVTGVFGVGGGFLIVPVLVMALRLPVRMAVGTSLAIIAVNSAIAAGARLGEIDFALAAPFVVGGVAAALVAGRASGRIDEQRLGRGFAVLVAMIGLALVAINGPAAFAG